MAGVLRFSGCLKTVVAAAIMMQHINGMWGTRGGGVLLLGRKGGVLRIPLLSIILVSCLHLARYPSLRV